MNFLDMQNEFEAVADYLGDPMADTNPCGLDESVFKEIVVISRFVTALI